MQKLRVPRLIGQTGRINCDFWRAESRHKVSQFLRCVIAKSILRYQAPHGDFESNIVTSWSEEMAKQLSALDRRLAEKAYPLIVLFKKRANDKQYYTRVRRCITALEKVSDPSEAAAALLSESKLDRDHASQINLILASTGELGTDLDQFQDKIRACSRSCEHLATIISLCTGVTVKAKQGRPKKLYVSETRDLMRVYEDVTRKPVVFPKGFDTKTGEAHQPSTEFIRVCLKKIDAAIGTATAITCIRNALKVEGEIRALSGR